MSPMEIWSNESQERYVLAIHKDNQASFEKICIRERCEYAIVGQQLHIHIFLLYRFFQKMLDCLYELPKHTFLEIR